MNFEALNILATSNTHHPEAHFLLWSIAPFVGLLFSIGGFSFAAANYPHSKIAHIWENNWNKLFIALGWAAPVLILIVMGNH